MSSKKKFLITLIAFCTVALLGIVSTAYIFAAGSRTVSQNITISYTVNAEVIGTLETNYKVKGGSYLGTAKKATFLGGKTGAEPIDALNSIALTPDASYVVFKFTFTPDTTHGKNWTVSLDFTGSNATNFQYSKNLLANDNDSSISGATYDTVVSTSKTITASALSVTAGTPVTKYFVIRVAPGQEYSASTASSVTGLFAFSIAAT